jgi:hypothetical protein
MLCLRLIYYQQQHQWSAWGRVQLLCSAKLLVAEYRDNQPMVYWFVVDTNLWSWWENPTFFCASSLGPIVQICVVNPSWVESRTGILDLEETVLVFFSPGFCFKSVLLRRRLWSHFKTLDAGEAMLLVHIWSWFPLRSWRAFFWPFGLKPAPMHQVKYPNDGWILCLSKFFQLKGKTD